MDICEHCHNVLAKTIDRCTVCGTLRADPLAADTRRRDDRDAAAHAPGWAAPAVDDDGLHAEDFLRELTGETAAEPAPPAVLPPRKPTAAPAGALAGYLGTSIDRTSEDGAADDSGAPAPLPPPPDATATPAALNPSDQLSTATKLTPDGVTARSTRLDGSVKLGPTPNHALLAFGAPLLAAVLVIGAVLMSYRIRTSEAEAQAEANASPSLDASAVALSSSAIVRLDLDGCGVVDQTTGFLFADQAIIVPRSSVITDDRPTVVMQDASTFAAEIVGWSLTRDLAVIRADQRLSGGLRWGVSGRSAVGEPVSVLTVTGPGVAAPVPATIESIETKNGTLTSFGLDMSPPHGSVILNADGFVIGIVDDAGVVQVSDDLSPAISRIVLANDRPAAECPLPPTTTSTIPPDDNNVTSTETVGAGE